MNYSDELRILAEMGTFTQRDFADAVGCTTQWASQVFERLTRERVIERVRVGVSYLYALTERGKARVAKMKPVDPEERCLLLVYIPHTERYLYHREIPVLDTSEDELYRDDMSWSCDYCGASILSPFSRCLECGGGGLG